MKRLLSVILLVAMLVGCTPESLVIKEQNSKEITSKKLLSNGRYSYELNSKDWNLSYESAQNFEVGDTLIIVSKRQLQQLRALLVELKEKEE